MAEQLTVITNRLAVVHSPIGIPVNADGDFFHETPSLVAENPPDTVPGIPEWEQLPPRDVWIYKPEDGKLPTPLNAHGVVDQLAVIALVKANLQPGYTYNQKSINPHHFQWPDSLYPNEKIAPGVNPAHFRDLPTLKGHLPRMLELFLHEITIPPPVPGLEIMHYYSEAWRLALRLYVCAENMRRVPHDHKKRIRGNNVPKGTRPTDPNYETNDAVYFEHQYGKYARYFDFYMSQVESIPPEFRIIHPDTTPRGVSARVGRLALRHSHQYKREARPQPAMAA